MEDEESQEKSILHRFADSPSFPLAMIAFGAFIALAESLFLLLQVNPSKMRFGHRPFDTFLTFLLRKCRSHCTFLCNLPRMLCLLIDSTSSWPASQKPIQGILFGIIGAVFASWIIFVLMDYRYIRGAFLLLPTIYGVLLLGSTLAVRGPPGLPDSSQNWKEKTTTILHVATVSRSVVGHARHTCIDRNCTIATTRPHNGYGAEAGTFDRTTLRYAYPLPEEVVAIQGPTEKDIEFSIYLTLPHLPEDPGIEGVPLAI